MARRCARNTRTTAVIPAVGATAVATNQFRTKHLEVLSLFTATQAIEGPMSELKKRVTIVIVSRNIQHALRVLDDCSFLLMGEDRAGELFEIVSTKKNFSEPDDERTINFIQGRFGPTTWRDRLSPTL